ncbi:hypothetical protein Hanom_Chr12g01132001 [Helianthus anomalus]
MLKFSVKYGMCLAHEGKFVMCKTIYLLHKYVFLSNPCPLPLSSLYPYHILSLLSLAS